MGRTRAAASARIERLAESVTILRQACAGERPDFSGFHYTVDGPEAWPSPSQTRIPILVGGGGKGCLELAAANADIVSISRNLQQGMRGSWQRNDVGRDGGPKRMDERLSWIRNAAGDRFDSLELHAIIGRAAICTDRITTAEKIGETSGSPPPRCSARRIS